MKAKVWIWTGVLAFLGYSIGGKSAVEHMSDELVGAASGAALGFVIGWSLQKYDEKRDRHGTSESKPA